MVPFNLRMIAKFGHCSNCSQNLDECLPACLCLLLVFHLCPEMQSNEIPYSLQISITKYHFHITSYFRVRMGPGKPGKSWNLVMAFSRTGKSWKKATGP